MTFEIQVVALDRCKKCGGVKEVNGTPNPLFLVTRSAVGVYQYLS
jgi:hypothetical protein